MTDKVTLTNLANLQNETTAVTAINANNTALTTAINNTLSRDGTSPNTMSASLDMNSQRILNLPPPVGLTEPLRLTDANTLIGGGVIQSFPTGGTTGQSLIKNSNTNYDTRWADGTDAIGFVIDGSGLALTTGLKGVVQIPFGCTIVSNTLLADQTGSVVVDVWKCTYAQYDASTHPVAGDKITASAPPTIAAGVKSTDSTLTGWTKTITSGDILAFNVNSASTVQRVTLILKVTR